MARTEKNLFTRILTWLRAGYPEGIPYTDHVALMGLLHRSLSDAEVRHIAEQLSGEGVDMLDRTQVAECIDEISLQKATDADIDRVSALLVGAGIGMAKERAERDAAAPAGN